MQIWLIIALCIVFFYAGYTTGGHIGKQKTVGSVIVNKTDQNEIEGIYTVWDIEPKTIDRHDKCMMDIIVSNLKKPTDSQESQGR